MKFQMPELVRESHPYFMYDEIQAQPDALRAAATAGREALSSWAQLFQRDALYLTGCGTSFHAAVTCEYWLRALSVAPAARAVEAFELSTGAYALGAEALVVAFSQSGGKGATLAAAARARDAGATTAAVTGHSDSELASAVNHLLWTRYASETSWAHTISYTTSLMAFLSALGETDDELTAHLNRLPEAFEARLRDEAEVREIGGRIARHTRVHVLGSGANFGTALEAALKLRETSYVHADAANPEYFLHGPISSLDRHSLLIAIAPPGAGRQRSLDVLRAARTIGARTLAVGQIGDQELEALADDFLELPPLREELTPLLYIVPLHLLSYWLAVDAGLNPDLIRRDQVEYRKAREEYEL
jgi:glucosamine--fructose-6-phosphate aminotransferase (isomerizing)